MSKEIRNYCGLRALDGSEKSGRRIQGYAIVFNSKSKDLGFREIIHPEAVTKELLKNSDIVAKFNHSDNRVLARSKYGEGTLSLNIDKIGLRYQFEAPHTSTGDELLELLRRGDIDSSSFAFDVDPEKETWERDDNGEIIRHIYGFKRLYDVSPVVVPAYSETTCSSRAMDKLNEAEKLHLEYMQMLKKIDAM